ncbi:MAG: hypothetical protein IRY91_10080, partial [Gemmatimonadaceae bacterium]|nr:hypothetical protein [Gemmatimonadaceae bacterium]
MERSQMMPSSLLLGEELPELLSDLAEAPDFGAAATLLLEQLAEAAGARRAALFAVDRSVQRLTLRQMVGDKTPSGTDLAVSLDEGGHPLTVAALGEEVVLCGAPVPELPFASCVLFPLPQPRAVGGAVPPPPSRE